MCRSEKGNFKVVKKLSMQKIWSDYWRGRGEGEELCNERNSDNKLTDTGDTSSLVGNSPRKRRH